MDRERAEAEARRRQAYLDANRRHPLPLSGAAEIDDLVMPAEPEPTELIIGKEYNAAIAEWVRQRLPRHPDPGPCSAIGVAIGAELIAGFVFHHYDWPTIEVSAAATSPRWGSRKNFARLFAYPFRQLGCRRLGATTGAKNQSVRTFLRRLGFREEGTARCALPDDDLVIYGMLARECRWLPQPILTGELGHGPREERQH